VTINMARSPFVSRRRSISRIDRFSHRKTRRVDRARRLSTVAVACIIRRRPMAFTMDALGAISSDSDDEDDDEVERDGAAPRAGASEASAASKAVDYEAIKRHGFRAGASVLARARAGDVGATAWGKGARDGARDGRYDAAESAELRYKAGAGLDACGKALEAAAAKAAEAEERRRKSREEAALSKARYMEAKQALRDADRAARRATVAVVEDETAVAESGAKRRKRVEASSKDVEQ